jgi:nucleoside 2-deoxyribosyltransferase
MGMHNPPEKCFITDSPTQDKPSDIDAIEYLTEYIGKGFYFAFKWDHKNSDFVENNKYILKGLIINSKFPYDPKAPYYNNEKLERIINEATIPRTPKSKLDNLINYLYTLQDYEGGEIDINKGIDHNVLLNKLYFKNHEEYWFYLSTLKDLGYINFIDASTIDGNDAIDIRITFLGLEYLIEIQESSENSIDCFVAMSFSDSMNDIRDTIKKTIIECGFNPILVDEINYESDITINDAIITNIKTCKFLIADFTEQKHGVYFEVGYALGKYKPVIYLCQDIDFKNSHFDTNHYPHIVYKNLNDLHDKLKVKIEAWIE